MRNCGISYHRNGITQEDFKSLLMLEVFLFLVNIIENIEEMKTIIKYLILFYHENELIIDGLVVDDDEIDEFYSSKWNLYV